MVRPAGYGYVAVLVDVAGALAAQLQGNGREVFGSGLHDQLSHHAVAGVEDVIEPLAQQLLGLRHSPGYYRVELLTPRRDTQQTGQFKQSFQNSAFSVFLERGILRNSRQCLNNSGFIYINWTKKE